MQEMYVVFAFKFIRVTKRILIGFNTSVVGGCLKIVLMQVILYLTCMIGNYSVHMVLYKLLIHLFIYNDFACSLITCRYYCMHVVFFKNHTYFQCNAQFCEYILTECQVDTQNYPGILTNFCVGLEYDHRQSFVSALSFLIIDTWKIKTHFCYVQLTTVSYNYIIYQQHRSCYSLGELSGSLKSLWLAAVAILILSPASSAISSTLMFKSLL